MNRTNRITCVAVLLAIVLFNACDQDTSYAESKPVPKQGWLASDTITLSPSVNEAGADYDVYLWIRHTKQYNYSNLWLKVISDPMLTKDSSNMLELPIADKTGRWLGHCSQSLCTVRILLKEDYRFEEAAAFKVDVLQYMREENLQEVRDLGLEIVQAIDGQ